MGRADGSFAPRQHRQARLLEPAQRDALFAIFRYIGMVVTGVTPEELQQAIIESAPMTESAEMTIAEILHQRGFEKGEASGRLEGRLEGQAALLERLLSRKFDGLPAWVHERLRQASVTELESWAERVLFADNLDSVFGE